MGPEASAVAMPFIDLLDDQSRMEHPYAAILDGVPTGQLFPPPACPVALDLPPPDDAPRHAPPLALTVVDVSQSVEQLVAMFPGMDAQLIQQTLADHNGDVPAAVEKLLCT